MRRLTHISLMLAAFILGLMHADESWAKNGRGGSKGGGGKSFKAGSSFHGHGGSSKSGAASSHRGKTKPSFATKHGAKKRVQSDDAQPWAKHQAREQRKLEHRQQVADHLREISDRNGNEHLKQVADDMDARAQTHYDKQMAKIEQKYGLEDTAADSPEDVTNDPAAGDSGTVDDSHEVPDGNDGSLDEAARKLTGRENALMRQLRNEERKLDKRMEEVERMRALAERTGDEGMLEAADRLEEWAMDHFQQRMTKIAEFRQRHGLPEAIEQPGQ
jgi:hypothetical protein